jgi:hypothetical protein
VTFETTTNDAGDRRCFVDGYAVPGNVFDTLLPSKMFPVKTGLTEEQALAIFERIKAETPRPETYKGPMFQTAISEARPLRSDALACHSSQREAIMARNKKHGLGDIRYDRAGRPCFTSEGQRRKLCKLEGVRSQNSAYGY